MTSTASKPKIVIGANSPLRTLDVRTLSNKLNISEGHLYRSFRGLPVGSDFIAASMVLFNGRRFDELFTVQVAPGMELAPASGQPKIPEQRNPLDDAVPTSFEEAQDLNFRVRKGEDYNELTGEPEPNFIRVFDADLEAYDLREDGSIYLQANALASAKVAELLRLLNLQESDLTLGHTIPAYLARGERNNTEGESD